MSRRRSTEATGITHATTPAPRRPQAGAAGVAAPVAPQASPNPSRESSSAAREGTPDRRAPSPGLRAYGRTWLPSAAGDVVPVTIARWTRGAARDGWCSPRGATPDMVAAMHFTGFGRVALDLARYRASDLRRAARDPRCEACARRAINRHLRTRRPSPTPRDADAMLREMVPLAPVLDRSPRPVRARSLARVVRAVEALPPPLAGRFRVCDAGGDGPRPGAPAPDLRARAGQLLRNDRRRGPQPRAVALRPGSPRRGRGVLRHGRGVAVAVGAPARGGAQSGERAPDPADHTEAAPRRGGPMNAPAVLRPCAEGDPDGAPFGHSAGCVARRRGGRRGRGAAAAVGGGRGDGCIAG